MGCINWAGTNLYVSHSLKSICILHWWVLSGYLSPCVAGIQDIYPGAACSIARDEGNGAFWSSAVCSDALCLIIKLLFCFQYGIVLFPVQDCSVSSADLKCFQWAFHVIAFKLKFAVLFKLWLQMCVSVLCFKFPFFPCLVYFFNRFQPVWYFWICILISAKLI